MIYSTDGKGDVYQVLEGVSLIPEGGAVVLHTFQTAEEVRSFLALHPDQRYRMEPRTHKHGRMFREEQATPAPNALWCGWVRHDSKTGEVVCESRPG